MTQALRIVTAADELAARPAPAPSRPRPSTTPPAGDLAGPASPLTTPAATGHAAPLDDDAPARSWSGRVFALALLAATVGGLAFVAHEVYFVVTDSWVAPLHLSPDSDGVAQLRLQHQRQTAEVARLDAEVTRIDGELAAIDAAVARLDKLRGAADATRRWQTAASGRTAVGLRDTMALLRRQRAQMQELATRQAELLTHTRQDFASGLVDRTALAREEQVRDQLAVELTKIDRQLAEYGARSAEARAALTALRDGTDDDVSQMPELAAGAEHTTRIDLEVEKLRADAVGQRALRAVAAQSAAAQRELLAELEARPLYRAMSRATDVAFIPYDQLAGVTAGARVMRCTWGVILCDQVGTVSELVPGEVVTQDPWGKLARGQYAVLALRDPTAVRERVLRVRR